MLVVLGFMRFHLKYGKRNITLYQQFVTLKKGQNIKYLPYAFTENGWAMLSSVLNSEGSSD